MSDEPAELLAKAIKEYVDDYALDDGECYYTPNEREAFLILDALSGFEDPRIEELQHQVADKESDCVRLVHEKGDMVERMAELERQLKAANSQAEEFERKWYLATDQNEEHERQLAHMGESLRDEVTARLDAEDRAEKAARRLAERDELLKRASKALLLGFPDLAGEICDATAKTWSDAAAAATPADPATPEQEGKCR